MLLNKNEMTSIIRTAGYKVEEEEKLLIVRTKSDDYVVSIPFNSEIDRFESHFVNSILND